MLVDENDDSVEQYDEYQVDLMNFEDYKIESQSVNTIKLEIKQEVELEAETLHQNLIDFSFR